MRFRILTHLFALAFLACGAAVSFGQHSLQIDNGPGYVAVINAIGIPPGITNYSLPTTGGMIVTTNYANSFFWKLNGNSLSSGVDGVNNNLGTNAGSTLIPVNIVINGNRVMRYTEGFTGTSPNVLGGSPSNVQAGGLDGSVIVGGGRGGTPNT